MRGQRKSRRVALGLLGFSLVTLVAVVCLSTAIFESANEHQFRQAFGLLVSEDIFKNMEVPVLLRDLPDVSLEDFFQTTKSGPAGKMGSIEENRSKIEKARNKGYSEQIQCSEVYLLEKGKYLYISFYGHNGLGANPLNIQSGMVFGTDFPQPELQKRIFAVNLSVEEIAPERLRSYGPPRWDLYYSTMTPLVAIWHRDFPVRSDLRTSTKILLWIFGIGGLFLIATEALLAVVVIASFCAGLWLLFR